MYLFFSLQWADTYEIGTCLKSICFSKCHHIGRKIHVNTVSNKYGSYWNCSDKLKSASLNFSSRKEGVVCEASGEGEGNVTAFKVVEINCG